MIFSKQLTEQTAEALGDTGDLRKLGETRARSPFEFFDRLARDRLRPSTHCPRP
jgi:hypothetical protein